MRRELRRGKWRQNTFVEDGVNGPPCGGKMKLERALAVFAKDCEQSIAFVVKLLGGSVGGDVSHLQPDSVAHLEVM